MIFELNGGWWHCGLDDFFPSEIAPMLIGVGKFRTSTVHSKILLTS